MNNKEICPVIILDYGSQYTQLIARKIREQNIFCKIFRYDTPISMIKNLSPDAIILSGGPASVYDKDAPDLDMALLGLDIPILGICYGMQLIIKKLSGKVSRTEKGREYGKSSITINDTDSKLFLDLDSSQQVWMSHGDSVTDLPEDFSIIAKSDSAIAAIANPKKNIYLVQFHPEVIHTTNGVKILKNFLFNISGIKPLWDMGSFIEKSIEEIKKTVGNKTVLCGISGGVDSSVLAVLLHKAIGDQLKCIFVDNGLLRKNERQNVERRFKQHFSMKIDTVDASEQFLDALKGVSNPEEKRKIIGNVFVKVFFAESGDFQFLSQGTLYPDVIESGGSLEGPAAVIKTHHNRVQQIQELISQGRIIEPFKDLFKDEVREIGRQLGMPDEVILRQPFPGPGLAIRNIGAIDRENLDLLRNADEIVVDEMKKAGLYYKTWQSFAVLLPIKSVGVMGDERTYDRVIAVRSVESTDGMTSHWSNLPYELLEKISNRIINEVAGINRVVYDISSKPPSTIEWE